MPTIDGGQTIVIDSVVPAAPVSGLMITEARASDPRLGAVGTAATFPPPGVMLHPVAGTVMTPVDGPTPYVQIVFGITLEGAGPGRVTGLRVRYHMGAQVYEAVIDDEYEVRPS